MSGNLLDSRQNLMISCSVIKTGVPTKMLAAHIIRPVYDFGAKPKGRVRGVTGRTP